MSLTKHYIKIRSYRIIYSITNWISFIPVLQVGVYAQQPQQLQQQQAPQQQNRVGISQVIKQIAQQVATANPGTNATHVYQILVQLAKQTAQISNQAEAIKDIRQIFLQVTAYPFGTLSQVLSHFAQQLASGNSNVAQIVQQAVQQKASSGGSGNSNNITYTLSNSAVQEASGGSTNVNQVIRQAAQIIANRAGVPVEKVEAVIIQMALQISQAQGKTITGQYIFQLANQIIQYPNGVLAQAILELVEQDDGGKSSHTTTIIKNYVKVISRSRSGGGDGKDHDRGPDPCKKDSKAPGGEPSEPSPLLQLDDGTTPPDTGNTASFKAADEGIEGGGTSPSDTNTVNDDGNTALDTGTDSGGKGGGEDTSSDGDSPDSS